MKKVGFTSTSEGMTKNQKRNLLGILFELGDFEFHHGDCVGGDEQAHKIAKKLNGKIVVHPPINPNKRAFCKGGKILPPKEYLARNKDIVNGGRDLLIAAPKERSEILRSGTWSTIRYARKKKREIVILKPTGDT